ncbi:MAG: YggS family pyridoxal phosphate-dependent enzyme [Ruminiclostridium sp.]|nr:YggS family pyridoxal phosphate-dependent enzyme [Ruminiclostridium sp.]
MTEKLFCNNEIFVQIKDNYERIIENISSVMEKTGRTDKVRLMAVTKTVPYETVNYSSTLGIDLLGENRVQEFLGKYEHYDKKCQIHFIGGLQTNKVKYIVDKVSMIQSVDSIRLADEINRRSQALDRCMDILIEVNIGGEESKSGVSIDELSELADHCFSLSNIRLRGFMAIPPVDENGSSCKYFEKMERIYKDCKGKFGDQIDTLSMGMSGDYMNAVRYGANIVRIGSALFGKRS